jgi:transcriptional regulator with GAF, ATPase, and Fis domain
VIISPQSQHVAIMVAICCEVLYNYNMLQNRNRGTFTEVVSMIDKDVFFREVTIRICSNLNIKTALGSVFEYLRKHFPLDALSLVILDASLGAMRRIAEIAVEDAKIPEDVLPLSEELWMHLQVHAQELHAPILASSSSEPNELMRSLSPLIKLAGNSDIIMPLMIAGERIGVLVLRALGEGRYTPAHAELMATVTEPFSIALSNALAHEKVLNYQDILIDENRCLNEELSSHASDKIVGSGSGLRNVMEMVAQVAPLGNSVLLLGETGTGKEVIANAIHFASPRKDGPFIMVNCGAIPENLIDSELFGHEKGAFTGAFAEKRGRFERAQGGTIFLDEIGELPLHAQTRLLRVLQNHEIERVGGNRAILLDIRIIAATHRNLEHMVSENLFREDLWFRLNVFPIIVPPLRQRRDDIPALTRHFISLKSREMGIAIPPDIAPGALERLMNYGWPGNVRELENLVERELILHRGGQLRFDSLRPSERGDTDPDYGETDGSHASLRLDEVVAFHMRKVLHMTKGKIHGPGGAAELLGLHPSTLRWRMDRLGIQYGRKRPVSS